MTCDSERMNESEIKKYEDCDVTPPGTFSPHLPETNLFPEKENVKLGRKKKGGNVSLGYIWENLNPARLS